MDAIRLRRVVKVDVAKVMDYKDDSYNTNIFDLNVGNNDNESDVIDLHIAGKKDLRRKQLIVTTHSSNKNSTQKKRSSELHVYVLKNNNLKYINNYIS